MNARDLKNSILQLAIEGKLVEQQEKEGTAKKLLEQIEEEKKKLIREGKIKKQKELPEIKEGEIPFDIPESWEWVRLGDLSRLITKGTTPRGGNVSYKDKGVGFLRAENVAGFDKLNLEDLKFVDENTHNSFLKRSILEENDILITIAGTLGRTGIVSKENLPLNANQAVSLTRLIRSDLLNLKYLVSAINAPIIQSILTGKKKTTAIPNLTLEIINECILPIPPLAEQKRIVAKIDELMPYVEKYDKAYSEVVELNKRFPEDMQKSILQYAIKGKLVEQREKEGTAEELYQQIQEEKKKLIKVGKIKKTKALPEIAEDEIPFDIPENWKWVRLGEIVSILGDGIHGTPVYNDNGDYHFINGNNLKDGMIEIKDNTKRVKEDQFTKHKRDLNQNTVLVSINGTIGNVAFYGGEKVILGKSACYFNLMIEDFKYYLYWVIKTKYFLDYAIKRATGTTIKNVSLAAMKEFVIPFPPLAEQKRIVEKIEELLPFTKQLVK